MNKPFKVKGRRERGTLVEFMVSKRTAFLDYVRELHTSTNGQYWMNVVQLDKSDLYRHFHVPKACWRCHANMVQTASSSSSATTTTAAAKRHKEKKLLLPPSPKHRPDVSSPSRRHEEGKEENREAEERRRVPSSSSSSSLSASSLSASSSSSSSRERQAPTGLAPSKPEIEDEGNPPPPPLHLHPHPHHENGLSPAPSSLLPSHRTSGAPLRWRSRNLPAFTALALSLSDLLRSPCSAREFVDAVYGMLLELECVMQEEKWGELPMSASRLGGKKAWQAFRLEMRTKREAERKEVPPAEEEEENENENEKEKEEEEVRDRRWRAEQPHYRMMMMRPVDAHLAMPKDPFLRGGLVKRLDPSPAPLPHPESGGGGEVEEKEEGHSECDTPPDFPTFPEVTEAAVDAAPSLFPPSSASPVATASPASSPMTFLESAAMSCASPTGEHPSIFHWPQGKRMHAGPSSSLWCRTPAIPPPMLSLPQSGEYFLFLQYGDVGGGFTGSAALVPLTQRGRPRHTAHHTSPSSVPSMRPQGSTSQGSFHRQQSSASIGGGGGGERERESSAAASWKEWEEEEGMMGVGVGKKEEGDVPLQHVRYSSASVSLLSSLPHSPTTTSPMVGEGGRSALEKVGRVGSTTLDGGEEEEEKGGNQKKHKERKKGVGNAWCSNTSVPAFPSYDAILPSLCTILILVYQKFCDCDHLQEVEVIQRVWWIDKKLNKVFFTPLTAELEAAAHDALWREATSLTWDGLFSDCRYLSSSASSPEKPSKSESRAPPPTNTRDGLSNRSGGVPSRGGGAPFSWYSLFPFSSPLEETSLLEDSDVDGDDEDWMENNANEEEDDA